VLERFAETAGVVLANDREVMEAVGTANETYDNDGYIEWVEWAWLLMPKTLERAAEKEKAAEEQRRREQEEEEQRVRRAKEEEEARARREHEEGVARQRLEAIERRLDELEREENTLDEAYTSAKIDADEYVRKMGDIEKERTRISREVEMGEANASGSEEEAEVIDQTMRTNATDEIEGIRHLGTVDLATHRKRRSPLFVVSEGEEENDDDLFGEAPPSKKKKATKPAVKGDGGPREVTGVVSFLN
jgi:chromosome segregation ATPase